MARLSRSLSLATLAAVSGMCAAVLVAGCTELLGADWDGRAAETADGAPGSGDGPVVGLDGTADSAADGTASLDGAASRVLPAIGLAAAHSCALDELGRLHCWGDNSFGQGGLNLSAGFDESSHLVPTSEPLRAVVGGSNFNCSLSTSGKVHCWGGNSVGELGRTLTGAKTADAIPGLVQGLIEPAIGLGARSDYVCAMLASGRVACWGRQVITSSGSDRPILVQGVDDVAALGVGNGHNCVVRSKDGSVACWGKNDKRQLGTDGVLSSANPITVALPGPAVDVVAGSAFSCALLPAGTVHCWGDDTYGQLGPGAGTATPLATPIAVPGISDARAIAAGDEHTCVATLRGTVVCWGDASDGRLGGASLDGGTVEVFGLSAPADQVGTGRRHSCAKLGDAAPMCWGDNTSGQLGNGDRTQSGPAPRTVAKW